MNDRAPGGSGSDRSGTVPDRPWLQHSRSNAASTRPRPNGGAAARSDGPAADSNGASNGASNGNNGASNGNGRQPMPGPRPGGSRDTRNGGALPPRSLQTPNGAAAGTADEASPLQSVKAKADSLKRQAADRKAAKAEARRRADAEKSIAAREAAPATPATSRTPSTSPTQAGAVTRTGAAAGAAAGATTVPETTSVRTPTITAQQPTKKAKPPARTRKARLRVTKIDPWSVMKISFLLSIAFGIVTVVMVYVVWTAITASSLFPDINNVVNKVVLGSQAGSTTPFRVQDYVHTNKIMGVTTLIAGVDVLIMTALATLGSFLYNLAASLLGGFELTLASDD